jgi:hypothetical protein
MESGARRSRSGMDCLRATGAAERLSVAAALQPTIRRTRMSRFSYRGRQSRELLGGGCVPRAAGRVPSHWPDMTTLNLIRQTCAGHEKFVSMSAGWKFPRREQACPCPAAPPDSRPGPCSAGGPSSSNEEPCAERPVAKHRYLDTKPVRLPPCGHPRADRTSGPPGPMPSSSSFFPALLALKVTSSRRVGTRSGPGHHVS